MNAFIFFTIINEFYEIKKNKFTKAHNNTYIKMDDISSARKQQFNIGVSGSR